MRRVIVISLLIVLSFLIQSTIFSYHDLTGIAPNLMLILTMSFGLMRGRREGLLTGFFCGFLYDLAFSSILGPYMLLYMFIGYMNGAFHKDFIMEDIFMPVVIISIDEFIFNFFTFVTAFLFRNRTDLSFYFIHNRFTIDEDKVSFRLANRNLRQSCCCVYAMLPQQQFIK